MNITIKEIADKAKVSIATVSRALNDDAKVKPETKEVIINLAKEFNYKPNVLARNFVKKKTFTLGLILPEVVDEFFTEIIRGVDSVAYAGGYNVMVAGTHSERTMAESFVNFMGNGVADGIILMAPSLNDQLKDLLTRNTTPTVLINSKVELENYNTVGVDNFQGAYSIIEYLIKNCNYKKIAHISGPDANNDATQRREAYKKALKDYSLDFNPQWLVNSDFTIKGGENACRRLLSLLDKPQVIFAANDMMAVGCYKAITSFGLNIPEDIGVVGFDDIFVSQFLTPRLTTIHVPIFELGKTAAELLLKRIENPSPEVYKHIRVTTGIVVGKSCKKINIDN